MTISPARIQDLLQQSQELDSNICPPFPGINTGPIQPAAVLIPLLLDQDVWKLLFIKRTRHQDDPHSGQIAFPGGRAEKNDLSLKDTALREVKEEIGINPDQVKILGQSCSITTVTDYEISPSVGILPWPATLTLSIEEVEKTLLIPINWLADPENIQSRPWRSRSVPEIELPVFFFNEFEGEILWGATAQIVVDFLKLIQLTS